MAKANRVVGGTVLLSTKQPATKGILSSSPKGYGLWMYTKDTKVLVESWSDILICFYAAKISTKMVAVMMDDAVLVYPGLRAATSNEPIPIYTTADQVSDDIVCREDKLVLMYRDYRHLSLWTSRIGPDTRATKIEIGPLQPPYALVSTHPRQDMLLVVSSTRKNKDDDREGGLFISEWTFNGDCVPERTIRIDPLGYPGNKAVAFSIQSCYPSCVQEVLAFAVRNLNAPKGKRRAVGLVTLEWQQQKFCSTILPIHTQAFMSQFGRGDFEGKSVMYRPTGLLAVFDTNTSNGHVVLDTTIPAYIVPDFGEF